VFCGNFWSTLCPVLRSVVAKSVTTMTHSAGVNIEARTDESMDEKSTTLQ